MVQHEAARAEGNQRRRRCAQVGFNVELGGYFSIKRNAVSIFGDTFLAVDQVVPYCKALLEVFRCAACPPGPINSTPNTGYTAMQVAVMRCLGLHPDQSSLAITCRTLCAVALALR